MDFKNKIILINKDIAINALREEFKKVPTIAIRAMETIKKLPHAQVEIIRCKNCEHWRQQTNYQGTPLPFGFCESDDMWRSLYGETYEVSHIDTDEDFYCGYAERRTYE